MDIDLDTSKIRHWRSIVTLVVFIVTNIVVLLPFHVPIYIPRWLDKAIRDASSALRITSPRGAGSGSDDGGRPTAFIVYKFPMNFVTAPLVADLFLLAILAIGREEVRGGTVGANHISPIDIMAFFLTLAYIAISLDASGLIRYLAFKVLQRGGKVGHRLFFYLYAFFFGLGSFIGNDPIILSGTAFLAYMTRVSSNIVHPKAWIYTQFSVANIASAILVSSNPTNLVLAGAFEIKFIHYTANMIVPVVVTAIVLFPFLLYIVFADESLIPFSIKMHELPEEARAKKPVNPNIPHARGNAEEEEKNLATGEQGQLLSLEEIMNPFLDKKGALFGAVIMAATLVTILALNASSPADGEHPVFWVTVPAAFVLFCWDMAYGWKHRTETREIARNGRREIENARAGKAARNGEGAGLDRIVSPTDVSGSVSWGHTGTHGNDKPDPQLDVGSIAVTPGSSSGSASGKEWREKKRADDPEGRTSQEAEASKEQRRTTLVSLSKLGFQWAHETFPTVTAVLMHLPFALVPFALSMFVLVQALVTKGWVPVFAYGWDHWVRKTGTVGGIGGMGFLSVVLCNFAGTNIGTTILLSRVIQAWQEIHNQNGVPISDRTFWATVYSMALGVNYGAFSTTFSASLAGLLWRDILARKHIRVRSLDFAHVNLPIIAIAMSVGCAVLAGEVYIVRDNKPYSIKG